MLPSHVAHNEDEVEVKGTTICLHYLSLISRAVYTLYTLI